jgi:hypothetical protein
MIVLGILSATEFEISPKLSCHAKSIADSTIFIILNRRFPQETIRQSSGLGFDLRKSIGQIVDIITQGVESNGVPSPGIVKAPAVSVPTELLIRVFVSSRYFEYFSSLMGLWSDDSD